MFLALHLAPGILDPLTPDVFIHSFEDDPYFWGLFNNAIAKKAILGYKLTIDL